VPTPTPQGLSGVSNTCRISHVRNRMASKKRQLCRELLHIVLIAVTMLYRNNLKSCCPVCLKGYARDDKTIEHMQKDHKGSPITQTKSSLGDEYYQMTESYKSILLSYLYWGELEIPELSQLFKALYSLVHSSHQSYQEVEEILETLLSDGKSRPVFWLVEILLTNWQIALTSRMSCSSC